MKTKRLVAVGPALAVVLATLFLGAGCQTPGRVVSVENSPVCPQCRMEVRTAPIKGMTYSKHICPGCKTESSIDSDAPAWRRGLDPKYERPYEQKVHVCDQCKALVSECPVCRKE